MNIRDKQIKKAARLFFVLSTVVISGLTASLVFSDVQPAYAEATPPQVPSLGVQIPGFSFKDYQIVRQDKVISVPYISAYINGLYKYILGVTLVVAAMMITYGGFLYILGSTGAQISDAKEKITSALVGLVIVIAGQLILSTINPATTLLVPLKLDTVDRHLEVIKATGDTQMSELNLDVPKPPPYVPPPAPAAEIPSGGAPPPPAETPPGNAPPQGSENAAAAGQGFVGVTDRYGNQGCATTILHPVPTALCNGRDACYQKYCVDKSDDWPKGAGLKETMKSFDYFPGAKSKKGISLDERRQWIEQYGIFLGSTLGSSRGCLKKCLLKDTAPYFPAATYLMPDAHDGLIKAGKIAKEKGYFIVASDLLREKSLHVRAFCDRVKEAMDAGKQGAGGIATPGSSPHNIGAAVDVLLARYDKDTDTVYPLTSFGPVCQQEASANFYGVKYVDILQDIMAQAGFRRFCTEVWHFDFGSVYKIDCQKCVFPPTPTKSECSKK